MAGKSEKTRGEFYKGTESAEGDTRVTLESELSLYKLLHHQRGHRSAEHTSAQRKQHAQDRTGPPCS